MMSNGNPPDFRSGVNAPGGGDPHSASGMPAVSLSVIYYALFRHKWLILGLGVVGLGAAVVAKKVIQPPYRSEARLLVRYVEEKQPTVGEESSRTVSPGGRGSEAILKTETDILTSYDLAVEVASTLGPKLILGETSDDPQADLRAAAGVVNGGLVVGAPRMSAVITVGFQHSDPAVVQPVLRQVIATYLKRHADVHRNTGDFDISLVQETDQRRSRLLQVEEELRGLLSQSGVVDLAAARLENASRSSRIQEDLLAAEAQLAELRAEIGAYSGQQLPDTTEPEATTSRTQVEIPPESIAAYRQTVGQLPALYRREAELMLQFTPSAPPLRGVRTQIEELEAVKTRLEREYPQISPVAGIVAPTSVAGVVSPNAATTSFDMAGAMARVSAIEARRKTLTDQLKRVRDEITRLTGLEARISELQRSKELQEQQYRYLATNLERTRVDEALGPGRVSNINELQSPRPPTRDLKQARMISMGLAAGGFALGIALALAIELFLDQRVKRPSEIESRLGLPLMMAIPQVKASGPSLAQRKSAGLLPPRSTPSGSSAPGAGAGTIAPWSPDRGLREFFDALRNRLIYNFEMRNISRKPKLVAVTSCGPDAGASTVAAGLAASLSETGDGNVLLVDMNPDRKTPQFFHKGDLKIGLDDVLAQETRDDALVQENLYMVSQSTAEDRLSWIIPKKFAQLIPKMKASDFDYIIFDMPPVSQVSATPQLARYMDQVLMVVESEKSSRDTVRRAGAMLTDAGANVGVVLNKTRRYVPAALDSETLGA